MDPPRGPHLRSLAEMVEKLAAGMDMGRPIERLEHLISSLTRAAERMRRDDTLAFDEIDDDAFHTLENIVLSRYIAADLAAAARAMDAEDN